MFNPQNKVSGDIGYKTKLSIKGLTREQATRAQRGSREQFYSFFNLGAISRPLNPRERNPVPIVQEAG
jgi:hypothetical protein